METMRINLIKDGKYAGITDGKKFIVLRTAFGVVTPGFAHLMPIFDSKTQVVDLGVDDFLMIQKALQESTNAIIAPTESVDVPTD